MPPLDSRASVGVDQLRAEVRRRADETSLRRTAGEIGIGLTGLRGFLAGADPYGPNLERLRAWYEWRVEGVELTARVHAVLPLVRADQKDAAVKELRRLVEEWCEKWRGAG